MMQQLVTCHTAQGVDEVPMIQIMELILIWVMSVGSVVEVMSRGVLHSILIASILKGVRTRLLTRNRTYLVFLFIIHEGSNSVTLFGVLSALTTNTNGSMANLKLVNRAGDDAKRSGTVIRRHDKGW